MILHPYHTADGRLWPELDERTVGFPVMCAYLACSRTKLYQNVLAGWLGKPAIAAGLWVETCATNPKGAGRWKFRPAVLWRQRGLGRYASIVAFDPRTVRDQVFCCDPRETAKRLAAQPAATPSIDLFVQSITQAVAAAAGLSPQRDASRLDSRNVLTFPVAR